MIEVLIENAFESWREKARHLLLSETAPDQVLWNSSQTESSLFDSQVQLPKPVASKIPRVSPDFLDLAHWVACHRDDDRWDLLYRTLWRITHGEPNLLKIAVDPDVFRLEKMLKAVRRDAHKMKAFVRFKKLPDDHYVAWYEPDYYSLKLTKDFFARRFNGMEWSIFTPVESAHWNGSELELGAGLPKSEFQGEDSLEELWKTYYASTFNPARIKFKKMTQDMPIRFWKGLPEAQVIASLIEQAPARLQKMYVDQPVSASQFIPQDARLPQLKEAVQNCRGCTICEHATQAVFGEGPLDARIVVVGEQPGDEEDKVGKPFVGPAGKLFDQVLKEIGVERQQLYVTNAVKHFKWKPLGKKRLHQRPNASEISACKPWLGEEMRNLQPEILVCLGETAAQSVLGKAVLLKDVRGKLLQTAWCAKTWVTTHPSAILRATPEAQAQDYAQWKSELSLALLA